MATELDDVVVLQPKRHRLATVSTAELANDVGAEGPAVEHVAGLLPRPTQYAIAAPEKTGKTIDTLDLGISVSCGLPYLDTYPTTQSPVVLYASELNRHSYLRFADAIARSKGLKGAWELHDLHVNFRAPQIASRDDVKEIVREVREHRAGVVIIDPYYRSASGVSGSQLAEAGAALGGLTDALFDLECTQVITHHTTKSSAASDGLAAFSGVGLQHWARTAAVIRAVGRLRVDCDRFKVRTLQYRFDGSDEGQFGFTVTRRLRKDEPGPRGRMSYAVEVTDEPADHGDDDFNLAPAARRTLAALTTDWASASALQDKVANDGAGKALRTDTVSRAADDLVEMGLAETEGGGRGRARSYRLATITGASS